MTRAELVTRAVLLYNEPTTSAAIATADWQSFADIIHQEICRDCRAFPTTQTLTLVSGTRTYSLGATAAGIRRGGVISSAGELIGPLTLEELNQKDKAWRTTAGTASVAPTHWYFESAVVGATPPAYWALGFCPVPFTTPPVVTVLGWSIPAAFTSDTDAPQMPTGLHDTIVWGMCWLAAVRDTDRAASNVGKLTLFRDEYYRRKTDLLQHMIDFGMDGWPLSPANVLKKESSR